MEVGKRGLGRTVGDCKQIGVGVGPAHQAPPPTCNFWLRPWAQSILVIVPLIRHTIIKHTD